MDTIRKAAGILGLGNQNVVPIDLGPDGTIDLERLGDAIKPECDHQFTYLGLQTLYDRYFIHSDGTRFELPQAFFMRVAMGLAIRESKETGSSA